MVLEKHYTIGVSAGLGHTCFQGFGPKAEAIIGPPKVKNWATSWPISLVPRWPVIDPELLLQIWFLIFVAKNPFPRGVCCFVLFWCLFCGLWWPSY